MQFRTAPLFIPVILFLCAFAWIAGQNRFASDDFEFLNKWRDYGWWGSVVWFHEHWNTRWASIGWLNTVFTVTRVLNSLLWYHLFSFGLLWFGFYRMMRSFIPDTLPVMLVLSGYSSLSFFFASFSISDVFFWVNTSTMYLYGVIALLFVLALMGQPYESAKNLALLAITGLFIAGAYEPLVFTMMISCLLVLIYQVRKHRWYVWLFPFDRKILVLLSALMLGFAISYAGEGHTVRSSYLPQTSWFFKSWVLVKALVKMYMLHLPVKLLYAMLFSFPFLIYGMHRKVSWLTSRNFKRMTIVFILLIPVSLAPIAFVMSEMGPERAWTQISAYITLYAMVTSLYAGSMLRNAPIRKNVLWVYVISASFFILIYAIPESIRTTVYARKNDQRMRYLDELKRSDYQGTVILEPLPDVSWLHTAEISSDSSHYINRFLKTYRDYQFDIKVR